jgi:hypothetical protein
MRGQSAREQRALRITVIKDRPQSGHPGSKAHLQSRIEDTENYDDLNIQEVSEVPEFPDMNQS